MKQPILPLEGDLLFEKKTKYKESPNFFLIGIPIISILTYSNIATIVTGNVEREYPDLFLYSLFIIGLILLALFWLVIILYLYEGFKDGFNNETYKGYYFTDKIILYRISKYVDEIYTQKLSKEQIETKIKETKVDIESMEKLLTDSGEEYSIALRSKKRITLPRLEKGLNLIENGLGKPHKTEVLFSTIKYFINEENDVKLVEKYDDDENNLTAFYNNLTLSKKYKKYQSDIVEFLNQRVSESAVFEDGDNVN